MMFAVLWSGMSLLCQGHYLWNPADLEGRDGEMKLWRDLLFSTEENIPRLCDFSLKTHHALSFRKASTSPLFAEPVSGLSVV